MYVKLKTSLNSLKWIYLIFVDDITKNKTDAMMENKKK